MPVPAAVLGAWLGSPNQVVAAVFYGAAGTAGALLFILLYEVHGTGHPLVLLHGGLGATSMFGANLPALSKGRQVIVVDLQGHGRTADIDRPISPELMAGDIAALIKYLKLDRPDLMGYSLGGGVALFVAIRHPELVGKLVLVSTYVKRSAVYPEMLAQ